MTALHMCMCIYMYIHAGLFGPTPTVKFKINMMIECPRQCVLQLSCEDKHEGLMPDCRISMKESKSEDASS